VPGPDRDEGSPRNASADEMDRAHRLADEARAFLAAEGYDNRRINELAVRFVTTGHGGNDEGFVDWALTEGRYS
jgi:hypothetical protein